MGAITLGTVPVVRIAYPPKAPVPVRLAAAELRDYLEASLGVALQTGEGTAGPGGFFVTTAQLSPEVLAEAEPFLPGQYDRCIVCARDGGVTMVGENPLSAQYAVYDFLQAYLGIRFFGPGRDHEHIPAHSHLQLADGFVFRRGSSFAIRNWVNRTNDPEVLRFAVKNRINTILGCGPWNPSLGSELCNARDAELVRAHGLRLRGPGHAWRRFIPDEGQFATHPEYFPMIDGQRRPNGRTACFSNPAVRDIFRENLRRFLREHPYWDVFAFWAEDLPDPFYCACPECRAMSVSDWYVTLANEAAAVVAEELPNSVFELIAYHGTRVPPRQVTRLFRNGANMLVNLCLGYSRDLYHPLAAKTYGSAAVFAMYQGWRDYLAAAEYQGQIMVMEYYNLCEAPNQGPTGRALLWPMDVILEDTRFYRQDGIHGLGAFTGFDCLCWPSPFNLWSWLRLWTDPDVPLEALKDDFYPAYFGAAGTAVREYMDLLQHAMQETTSAANVEAVCGLSAKLDSIHPSRGSAHLPERLRALRIHHEYCVLVKELFCAFIENAPATWEALEGPFERFFEAHRDDLQKHLAAFPPLWSNSWVRSHIRTGFSRWGWPKEQLLGMLR